MTARLPDSAVSPSAVARMEPALIADSVMHRRTRPAANAFTYPAFCLRLPLSQLEKLADSGVRRNRRGLVSFHDRDHGPRDGRALEPWIRDLLARENAIAEGEIVLYAFPRMLGYVFNPVSFWVCHDGQGGVRAVLAEVSNTFGETHRYLLAHADGRALASGETLSALKSFHVSPFCEVKGRYTFRFHFGADRWLARIDYFDDDTPGSQALLETSISGNAESLPANAAKVFWRYRWFTLGVIARIHWQAAKLLAKRVPHFSKPPLPPTSLTRNT